MSAATSISETTIQGALPIGARQKLNSTFVFGSVILASVIGTLSASWTVFFLALALLLALGWYEGGIRFRGRK